MKTILLISLTMLGAGTLASCAPSWNAQIRNNLGSTSHIEVSGPGKCSGVADTAPGAALNLQCDLTAGAAVKFTDKFGQACRASPDAVAHQVQTAQTGSAFWRKKFAYVRLSELPCD